MSDAIVHIAQVVLAHRRRTLLIAALVAAIALPWAVLLYRNLRSALEELLPRDAPSVVALDVLHRRLGESLQLSMLVSGAPTEKLHRFADRMADEALRLPRDPPRLIDYRPGVVQNFFLEHRMLFADLSDLRELSRRIDERIEWEVRHANPFDLTLDLPAKPPGFDDLFERYKARQSGLEVKLFPSGYYDGADGRSLAMIFFPSSGMSGYESSLAFRDEIKQLAHRVAAESGVPQVKIEFGGDAVSIIEEQHSLIADLVTSSIIVVIAEGLLLFAFFRWWPGLAVLGFPLAVGTLTTFAVAYFVIGSVNASTAFLGSIIIGNGVNTGIILLSRFMEERRAGRPPRAAMITAVRATALPTFVAAAAAAVSYAALLATTLRGYNQFGFMGALGMVLCWSATYLIAPAVAVALDARWPVTGGPGRRLQELFAGVARLGLRRSRRVITAAGALTLAASVGIAVVGRDPLEHNINKLRSRVATEKGGSQDVNTRIDAIVGRFLTPEAILVDSRDQVEPLARRYKELIAERGPSAILGSVLSLQSFVPDQQEAKLQVLREIRAKLTPKRLARVDAKTRRLVYEWLPPANLAPFAEKDLPSQVRRAFREIDGSTGRMLLLFPKVGTNTSDGKVLSRFAKEVRSVPLPPGAVLAGSSLLFADIFHDIARDGPLATGIALFGVMLLTLLLGVARSRIVELSLLVGVCWMLGAAAALGVRINFLNFAALPITFGIGVDYAANIARRFQVGAQDAPSLVEALAGSGAAVAVCSATTIIGYSSLLFSRNGALFSFGLLAVLGEIACLSAALLLLPALFAARCRRQPQRLECQPSQRQGWEQRRGEVR